MLKRSEEFTPFLIAQLCSWYLGTYSYVYSKACLIENANMIQTRQMDKRLFVILEGYLEVAGVCLVDCKMQTNQGGKNTRI